MERLTATTSQMNVQRTVRTVKKAHSLDASLKAWTGTKAKTLNIWKGFLELCPRCMNATLECNGAANCDDWSDEDPALCNDCKKQENVVKCDDSLFCLMKDPWLCNGFPNCLDMSDELSPHFCNRTCDTEDTFWCKDGTTCVPADSTCNGFDNCPDESDETQELCQTAAQQGTFRCNHFSSSDKSA